MIALLPLLRRFAMPLALVLALTLAWHFQSRAVANAEAMRAQAAQFKQAQAEASRIAQEALHHQEAQYRAKAEDADHAYTIALSDARGAAAAYITSHRVRAEASKGGASGSVASAEGSGASVPASLPADGVVVSASDVQACTDVTAYALKAHEWVLALPTQ